MKTHLIKTVFLALLSVAVLGCGSDLDELIDAALDPPSRKPIDTTRMGVNNFFVHSEFGSTANQFLEIRDTLGLHHVRVLFAWTTAVQPSPSATPNYSFYDQIASAIPANMDIIVVLAHTPDWMSDSSNWVNGNPRQTWVEQWLRPTVMRYAGHPRISGWEIWNEPDVVSVASDSSLGLTSPSNYIQLLQFANPALRSLDPTKLIIMAASRSIQQNWSANLDYNKSLRDLGAESLVDIWNIHYYGEQWERVVQGGGVESFLDSLTLPIWITESGAQGVNNQLSYVETAWPFLREKVPGIDRIYYYEFGSDAPLESNFGLRTTDASFPVSDLYVRLRDG